QFYLVLAHVRLDRQHRGLAGRRQRLQGASRTVHLVADPLYVEDDVVLAVGVDQTFQLADHRATASLSATLWRWWAWVIAIASASAASAVFGSALGRSTPSITRIWVLSAWPAPTTAFLTWFGAYSATVRPHSAGASIATPRAWPSFNVAAPSLLTKVCSTAASAGENSPSTRDSPS